MPEQVVGWRSAGLLVNQEVIVGRKMVPDGERTRRRKGGEPGNG